MIARRGCLLAALVAAGCSDFVGADPGAGSTSVASTNESGGSTSAEPPGTTSSGGVTTTSEPEPEPEPETDSASTTTGCMPPECDRPPPDPRCDDGVRNAEETDIDCGGPRCEPCADGNDCLAPEDCESLVCADACVPASCEDGVRNGDEADVDCGGSCDASCGVGSTCAQPEDCDTSICARGECRPRVCSDLPAERPSGIYGLYFEGQEPTEAFCDMQTDGGGWTLVLAYRHIGGTNEELVAGDLPISPVSGFSHASPLQVEAIREGATALRLYCTTSAHTRILHFRVDVPGALDYFANLSPTNEVEWWRSDFTALAGHTAALPGTADTAWENIAPAQRMTDFPFFDFGATHWGIRGSGVRWECDDFAGTAVHDTLHQVWIR